MRFGLLAIAVLFFSFVAVFTRETSLACANISIREDQPVIKQLPSRTILGHTFKFEIDSEENVVSLLIFGEHDTTSIFDELLFLDGGDCNGRVKTVGDYVISNDSLFYYHYSIFTETFDIFKPHTTVTASKDIFVFRANGKLEKVSSRETTRKNKLWKEVTAKLEKQINTL